MILVHFLKNEKYSFRNKTLFLPSRPSWEIWKSYKLSFLFFKSKKVLLFIIYAHICPSYTYVTIWKTLTEKHRTYEFPAWSTVPHVYNYTLTEFAMSVLMALKSILKLKKHCCVQ